MMRPRYSIAEQRRRDSRGTPPEIFDALNAEFRFTLDPCPLDSSSIAGAPLFGRDGLGRSWRWERVFCNPPYSCIAPWLAKHREAELAVYLLPVRSDASWWHDDLIVHASEVRFFRGRLRFEGTSGGAPFPSCLAIFDGQSRGGPVWRSQLRPARASA